MQAPWIPSFLTIIQLILGLYKLEVEPFKRWKHNQKLSTHKRIRIPLYMPLLGIIYKNILMATWTNKQPTLGQMVTCLLNSNKFLSFVDFPFWNSFFLSYVARLPNFVMHLVALCGVSFPFLHPFIMSIAFSKLYKTLIPDLIGPQHYWWLMPNPST